MRELPKYAFQELEKAFSKLKEGAASAQDELEKDGVIQRFEFTFEQLWKTLKIFLEHQGIIVKTPRDSFKEAFRIDLIEDEETFFDMMEDRNRTSHIYDKEVSEEIFKKIKSSYVQAIERVLGKLKERFEKG